MLKSWLKNLNYIRNICAHHARLWNVNVVEQISPRTVRPIPELTHIADSGGNITFRVYATLALLALLTTQIHPGDEWTSRMRGLVDTLPPNRSEQEMGFPTGWRDLPLWNPCP